MVVSFLILKVNIVILKLEISGQEPGPFFRNLVLDKVQFCKGTVIAKSMSKLHDDIVINRIRTQGEFLNGRLDE